MGQGEWGSGLDLGVGDRNARQGASYSGGCPSGSAMFSSTRDWLLL